MDCDLCQRNLSTDKMRQRKIKDALIKIKQNDKYFIENPLDYKGAWHTLFNNSNPIELEIGMGKGKFLIQKAMENPQINYIGIEKVDSVLLRASQKLEQLELKNIKIINVDAKDLLNIFEEDEISNLYLNFTDPWPKNGYKKRRLTNKIFLDLYKEILDEDGRIYFKTDNIKLFEYSLIEFNQNNLDFINLSLDLHNSNIEGNIKTEYEEKFEDKGPIYYIEVKFR